MVARGCATKISSGRYEATAFGACVRKRFVGRFERDLSCWGVCKTLQITRDAIRPGPRQLIEFEIIHWPTVVPEGDVCLSTTAASLCRVFAQLALPSMPLIAESRVQIVTTDALRAASLPHALATVETVSNKIQVSVGIETGLIAICAAHPIWPASFGRMIECFVVKSQRSAATVSDLRKMADARGIPLLVRHCSPSRTAREIPGLKFLIITGGRRIIVAGIPNHRKVFESVSDAFEALNESDFSG